MQLPIIAVFWLVSLAQSMPDPVLAAALSYVGSPALWGSCSHRGIDHSCLIQRSYAAAGVSLPRTSTAQWRVSIPIARQDVHAGDLVFTDSPAGRHVSLAVSDDVMLVAPDGNGQTVKLTSLPTDASYRRVPRP